MSIEHEDDLYGAADNPGPDSAHPIRSASAWRGATCGSMCRYSQGLLTHEGQRAAGQMFVIATANESLAVLFVKLLPVVFWSTRLGRRCSRLWFDGNICMPSEVEPVLPRARVILGKAFLICHLGNKGNECYMLPLRCYAVERRVPSPLSGSRQERGRMRADAAPCGAPRTATRAPSFSSRSRIVQTWARAQVVPAARRRNSCISTVAAAVSNTRNWLAQKRLQLVRPMCNSCNP